jgi:adenylate kinase
MALNVIMLGPPGAGKGTQAERFARTRGIPKISTGDILRAAVHNGTEIGRRAKAIMDRGQLVSDDVMIGIVQERIEQDDARAGFVLDGFPRTVAQATALDGIMSGRDALIVVDITVPESELVRRLTMRLICEGCGATSSVNLPGDGAAADRMVLTPANAGDAAMAAALQATTDRTRCERCGGRLVQRADDDSAVILERLKVYHHDSAPIVEYYRARPTFRSINGAQPPDRVAAALVAAIEAVGNGASRTGARR